MNGPDASSPFVLVRPALVIVLDELRAERPVELAWLMHTIEESTLAPDKQAFTVRRDELRMEVQLAASAGPLDHPGRGHGAVAHRAGGPVGWGRSHVPQEDEI